MNKMTTLKNALRLINRAKGIVIDGDCKMSISFYLHEEEFGDHVRNNNLEVFAPSAPHKYGAYDNTNENLSISFCC